MRLREELAPGLEIVRLLGSGSMASVYLAREAMLRRLVAVKVLAPEVAVDARARLRFEREAQAVASLSHPGIVAIYRVDRLSNELPFLVMQYVKGRSLAERLKAEGPLPVEEARRILADLAAALAAAHRKGIVHRDVKPANVLWEEESGRVLLCDFGVAAVLDTGEEQSLRLTQPGEVLGQLTYISPEQMAGGSVTEQADLYSLGVLGYELLTGRRLSDTSTTQGADDLGGAAPRKISELRSDVDPELEMLIERCLAQTPTHRPSAADLARRLAQPAGPRSAPLHGLDEPVQRLAALIFADIVGYTHLTSREPDLALRLVNLFQEVSRAQISHCSGRLVKFMGDGLLAQFNSTAAAAQAALGLRREFAARSTASRMTATLRIGLHVGDVVSSSDGDVYGDAVNITSRLQEQAEPGQVLVSGEVWRQLRTRPEYRFRALGERTLKGLSAPLQLYELIPADEGDARAAASSDVAEPDAGPQSRLRSFFVELRRRHLSRAPSPWPAR